MQQVYLRHALELAIIFPASLFSMVPMRGTFRFPPLRLILSVFAEEVAVILIGAWVCTIHPDLPFLFLGLLVFFPSMMLVTRLSV